MYGLRPVSFKLHHYHGPASARQICIIPLVKLIFAGYAPAAQTQPAS